MVSDPPRQRLLPRRATASMLRAGVVDRVFPLLAMVTLVIVGMLTTTWGAHLIGQQAWSLPHDLWRTLVAADRVRRLDLGGLYTPPTQLIAFPGAALILVPIVALIHGAGGNLAFQTAQNPEPAAWLLAGPYEIAVSAVALFAADAIARRRDADSRTRALLAVAGAVALWNVCVRFGHPEDAVAVALLLYGTLALSEARITRSGWLIGVGVAVQPLILLGLPVVLAALPVRKMVAFLVRAALPGVIALGAAALANSRATVEAVTRQPNWPTSHSNHSTPWTSFAPEVGGGAVSAGPGRIVAILLALTCAVAVRRRRRVEGNPETWTADALQRVFWWVSVALGLRCVFESVMVSFYLWPALAVALVAASISWPRLVAGSAVVSGLTFLAQASWHGPWLWWGCMVAGLGLVLAIARQPGTEMRPDEPLPVGQ